MQEQNPEINKSEKTLEAIRVIITCQLRGQSLPQIRFSSHEAIFVNFPISVAIAKGTPFIKDTHPSMQKPLNLLILK
jgi:hypothetical protein